MNHKTILNKIQEIREDIQLLGPMAKVKIFINRKNGNINDYMPLEYESEKDKILYFDEIIKLSTLFEILLNTIIIEQNKINDEKAFPNLLEITIRIAADISIKELSEKSGISIITIEKWETYQLTPALNELLKISKATNINQNFITNLYNRKTVFDF